MKNQKEKKPRKCKVTKHAHVWQTAIDPKYEVCQHCHEIRIK